MTKAEALVAMRGNAEGLGKGLTTFPESEEEAQIETHAACLELEDDGACVRHLEAVNHVGEGHPAVAYVIWMPVPVLP
jgi:hypothetical protein